ncbi:MAG: hypothetical protein ACR2HR_05960 [Euzebya sp.]
MLIELYGDEEQLKSRIDAFRQSDTEVNSDLLSLADKYLSDWRPDQFED